MKITLLTMGKTDIGWVKQGLEMYVSRLSHYIQFNLVEIPELKRMSSFSPSQIKDKEADVIMPLIKSSDEVILLDEHGREFRSIEFADYLQKRMVNDSRDMVFVIGGAYGFSQRLYDRANGKISLSKMTYSHQLVRTVFAEQLYRAFTIIKGEPYHNE